MVIKNLKIIQETPAIIEIEFEPISDKFINRVYKEDCFKQLSFEQLEIIKGRTYYREDNMSKDYRIIKNHFLSAYEQITKIFLELDRVRYPVIWESDNTADRDVKFSNWYSKTNMANFRGLTLCLDYAGFHQGIHLDNRFSMWAGIINLQDNVHGTYHYSSSGSKDIGHYDTPHYFIASGKKMTGTFWLNTENTWHGVPPLKENRKVIICNQHLCQTWGGN